MPGLTAPTIAGFSVSPEIYCPGLPQIFTVEVAGSDPDRDTFLTYVQILQDKRRLTDQGVLIRGGAVTWPPSTEGPGEFTFSGQFSENDFNSDLAGVHAVSVNVIDATGITTWSGYIEVTDICSGD